jgi:3-phosphoshikimate 1-carboxyvinyltransferase
MRFLLAYVTVSNQNKILTGTDRMKERPIGILVDALREIGADIKYMESEGFPPVEILGLPLQKSNSIKIRGDVSSQFISALLMVAPVLPKGLHMELTGTIGSRPYIQMTLDLMSEFGLKHHWKENSIHVPHQRIEPVEITIEPDWSGASYWYSFVALSMDSDLEIFIPGLLKNSMQGDSIISKISEPLGVITEFNHKGILLKKGPSATRVEIDFSNCPDLAQTVAVICAGKNINGIFTGLRSLRIKETDRIKALQNELSKINASLNQKKEDVYDLIPSTKMPEKATIRTYEDHRMAMAFAPLSMLTNIEIEDPEVINKSYPTFWNQVQKAGVECVLG